jgi:hypothetical protein
MTDRDIDRDIDYCDRLVRLVLSGRVTPQEAYRRAADRGVDDLLYSGVEARIQQWWKEMVALCEEWRKDMVRLTEILTCRDSEDNP